MDAPAADVDQTGTRAVVGSSRLTSEDRIRRRPEFERAYDTGARIHGRFMTVFVVPNGGPRCRLGVAATRKLGSAVARNRVKRLAREIFRRHKPAAAIDVVIVPRREMLDAPFASLETDFLAAIERRDARRGRVHAPTQPRSGGRHRRPARV